MSNQFANISGALARAGTLQETFANSDGAIRLGTDFHAEQYCFMTATGYCLQANSHSAKHAASVVTLVLTNTT